MNVLVDTDVLIDLALDRSPHSKPAGLLLDLLQKRRAEGFLAWHSASNFYYLVAPKRGKADSRAFLLDLAQFMEIAPTTTDSLRQAGRLELRDFEDAMQVAAAIACGAEVIATRNLRDYGGSPIKPVRPMELIKALS